MPDVRLTRKEEKGVLPDVCMCCGAPATAWVERTFLLRDPHVPGPSGFVEVFLVRLAVAAANAPRFRLRTSFCPQHRRYWLIRSGLLFGGLAALLAALVVGFAFVAYLLKVHKFDSPLLTCCILVPTFLVLIPWVVAARMMTTNTMRVRVAEDDAVVLQNVDERYVAAVEAARQRPRPPRHS
jgi:hypothetical protein